MAAEIYLRRQAQAVEARQSEPVTLLVDERAAAQLLGGVCVKTLYHLRKRRGLPFVTIGTRILYRPADLARWIDGQAKAQGGAEGGEQ